MLYDVTCSDMGFLINIAAKLLRYLHFLIPILLIILVLYDVVRTFFGNIDDKAKKDMGSKILKRVIYAVIIFLIPTVLFFVFDKIRGVNTGDSHSNVSETDWYDCFTSAYNG